MYNDWNIIVLEELSDFNTFILFPPLFSFQFTGHSVYLAVLCNYSKCALAANCWKWPRHLKQTMFPNRTAANRLEPSSIERFPVEWRKQFLLISYKIEWEAKPTRMATFLNAISQFLILVACGSDKFWLADVMFTSVGISKSNCLVWIYGTQLENTMSFVVFAILCAPGKNILASLTTSFLVIINTAVIYSSDNSTVSDSRIVLTFGFRRSRRFCGRKNQV